LMTNLRRTRRAAQPLLALLALLALFAGLARADAMAATPITTRHPVRVVQVTGPIDPVTADLVTGALRRAKGHAELVILQLDSRGALDSNARRVWRAVAGARVPVAVWVGPSGATANGAAAFILEAATVAVVAPETHVGPAVPTHLDGSGTGVGLAA